MGLSQSRCYVCHTTAPFGKSYPLQCCSNCEVEQGLLLSNFRAVRGVVAHTSTGKTLLSASLGLLSYLLQVCYSLGETKHVADCYVLWLPGEALTKLVYGRHSAACSAADMVASPCQTLPKPFFHDRGMLVQVHCCATGQQRVSVVAPQHWASPPSACMAQAPQGPPSTASSSAAASVVSAVAAVTAHMCGGRSRAKAPVRAKTSKKQENSSATTGGGVVLPRRQFGSFADEAAGCAMQSSAQQLLMLSELSGLS